MNDNNIIACIEYAKQNNLACADDALEDYKALVKLAKSKIRPTMRAVDVCPVCGGSEVVQTIHGLERCLNPIHGQRN